MVDISVNNLHKSYELGDEVLNGISFSITEGERVAILGPNGCGKTTLFKILTGQIDCDSGSYSIASNKRIGLISQIPDFPKGWTVDDVLHSANREVEEISHKMRDIENNFTEEKMKEYDKLLDRFNKLGGYDKETVINKTANGLNIAHLRDRQFSVLSGGEQTRVNLARLIIEDTDILLMDEPTNHLDLKATIWLENYISRFKGTVVVISHDRFFLDKVVSRCIEIVNGQAEFYNGNYSFFKEEKVRRYNERLKQYEKDSAKIEQLTKAAEQMHLWAFMGMDKLHKRAFSMEKRIEKLKTTQKPVEARKLNIKFKEADFNGDEVLDILSLCKSFNGKKLLDNLNLEVVGGESIAVIGDNGTGKSTFLKMIVGEEQPDSGIIRIAPQVKIAYLPQIVSFQDESRSCYDSMLYETKCTPQQAYDRLAMFGFRGEDIRVSVGALSGGERSRLKLCMLMGSDINLLILDEPTNHLDIASREWIETSIEEYDKTLLFVSHDRFFIDKFATRILSFNGNAEVEDYHGNYKEYLQYISMKPVYEQEKKTNEKTKKQEKQKTKLHPYSINKIEKEIDKLESQIKVLDEVAEINNTDYVKLIEIEKEKSVLYEKLRELYEKWEEMLTD